MTIPQPDTYTITAWWANAPVAGSWVSNALFEVVANGQVRASAVTDQRTGGDQWHSIATVALTPQDNAYVQLTSPSGGVCVADAIHVRSAARYNDDRPTITIMLAPMDGIILEWTGRKGDFDANGTVDLNDFSIFSRFWLDDKAIGSIDIVPLGGDNLVNILDLMKMAENWLEI